MDGPSPRAFPLDRVRVYLALLAEAIAVALMTNLRPALVLYHAPFLLLVPAAAAVVVLAVRPTRLTQGFAGLLTAMVPIASAIHLQSVTGGAKLDPRAAYEFVAFLLMGTALALALPASLRTLSRPHGQRYWGQEWTPPLLIALVAVVAGASATSMLTYISATAEAERGAYDVVPESVVRVVAVDVKFVPQSIVVQQGIVTEVVVENRDPVFHTLSYSAGDRHVRQDLLPSSTTRFLVLFDSLGPVAAWCAPHSQDHRSGMVATIEVVAPVGYPEVASRDVYPARAPSS